VFQEQCCRYGTWCSAWYLEYVSDPRINLENKRILLLCAGTQVQKGRRAKWFREMKTENLYVYQYICLVVREKVGNIRLAE
jgi:hypothetical protein